MADLIYLSPHLDDAVWSCGGQIAQHTRQAKSVLVVTVCAGDPPADAPGPALAQPSAAPATRRAEDLAALALLGAQPLHLPALDGIYRVDPATGLPLYGAYQAMFDALPEAEGRLIEALVGRLRRLEPLAGAAVYVPLAAGRHVDHQLVRAAAERWGAPGGRMVYYEDYPYAEFAGTVQAALARAAGRPTPILIPLEPADIEIKTQAMACYKSQVPMFFSDGLEMTCRVLSFACSRADEVPLAERVWTMESQ